MDYRRWLYRAQQRLALTKRESQTLAVLLLLLGVGVAIRHYREHRLPYEPAYYAERHAPFASLDSVAASPDSAAAAPTVPADPRIRLNEASVDELVALPRIGPKMAERIVAFREAHGPFRRLEDLRQIRGIGDKTIELLRPYVSVD
jgi:competence protein ComEA